MPTSAPGEPSWWDTVPTLARLATRLPCAVLSLGMSGRQRCLRAQGVPLSDVISHWAAVDVVHTTCTTLVVPDLATSAYAAEPFVQQHPELPFFAGVPIAQPNEQMYGVLYAMGPSPAAPGDVLATLEVMAHHVADVCRLQSQTDQVSRILPLMCHELNTPLNGIMGLATMMEAPEAEVIAKSAEHAIGAVRMLKDFLQSIQGTLLLDTAPFSLHNCVAEAAACVHPVPPQVKLQADHSCDMEVFGDRTRVVQVLETLLENAVKFTTQGEVTVRVAPPESPGQLHLEVNDTGVGMSPTQARRLFQWDTLQQDTAAYRRCGAPGFGLVVAQALCAAMGGRMWASSAAGRGSTFHFTVCAEARPAPRDPFRPRPVLTSVLQCGDDADDEVYSREEGTPQSASSALSAQSIDMLPSPTRLHPPPISLTPEPSASDCTPGSSPPNTPLLTGSSTAPCAPVAAGAPEVQVLVVDDNRINQRVLVEFLQRLQVHVDVVDDGAQAVEACMQRSYELVLMDVEMPVMDGMEATVLLRRSAEAVGRQCPCVVGVSANTLDANRAKCLSAGMELFLPKPVRFPLLREVVEWVRTKNCARPWRLSLPTPCPPPPPVPERQPSTEDLRAFQSLQQTGVTRKPRSRFALPSLEALLLDSADPQPRPAIVPAVPQHVQCRTPAPGFSTCLAFAEGRASSELVSFQPRAPKGSRLPRFLRPRLSDRASM